MKLTNHQKLWVTPLIETPVFEKTLLPQKKPVIWEHQIVSLLPLDPSTDLSPRAQQILAHSRQIQAELRQLTQGQAI
jgi:hypothetical protein